MTSKAVDPGLVSIFAAAARRLTGDTNDHKEPIMHLTLHTFLTLDGVMQGPGGVEEDRSDGFSNGGWTVPYFDQDMGEIVDDWFSKTDAILFGRTTYELMKGYWPNVSDPDNRAAQMLNTRPKYVVSSTLQSADWGPTTILDSLDAVRALKAREGGELQVHGSAGLAAALHAAGMVDEYRLATFPVTVGAGKRLFTPEAPASGYEPIASRTTGTGVTYVELRPTPFTGGTFTIEDGRVEAQP
jgi:dihydrofolate reductase